MKINHAITLSILSLSLTTFAQTNTQTNTPSNPQTANNEGSAARPTDPQIAAIVVAANTVDINAGKAAKAKTKNAEVRKFAEQMITDHTSVNKSAVELVTKLKVTPQPSETSKALEKGGEENLASLKKLSGKEFDKAYVDHEVAYHQTVLDSIDKTLLPSAQNAELKALLAKVRPAIAEHLQHAQHMQSTLK